MLSKRYLKPDMLLTCQLFFLIVVLGIPATAAVTEPFPVNVIVLQDTGKTPFTFSYEQAMQAFDVETTLTSLSYIRIHHALRSGQHRSQQSCIVCTRSVLSLDQFENPRSAVVVCYLCLTGGEIMAVSNLFHEDIDYTTCSESVQALLPLVKYWNIPIVSPVGSGQSDPLPPYLVTRLSPYNVKSCVIALAAILTKYKWYNVAIIYDEISGDSVAIRDGLLSVTRNVTRFNYRINRIGRNNLTTDKLALTLVEASLAFRVFILACQSRESRALMLEAYNLGYATSGEYVFFIIDELSKVPSRKYWEMGQPDDQVILASLGNVIWPHIDVDVYMNPEVEKMLSQTMFDTYGNNNTELSPHIIGYFEAMWIYALVLNETLKDKRDPFNGVAITRSLWNRTFDGLNGPIRINKEGYRQNNVTFSAFNLKTGLPEPRAFYDYEMANLEDFFDVSFDWPYSGGIPPLNEPTCGYKNNLCVAKVLLKPIIGSIAGLIGLAAVAAFIFMYRSWKSKSNSDLWWWEIPSRELTMAAHNDFSSMYRANSKVSLRQVKTIDENSLNEKFVEDNIVIWKGQTVNLRRLPLKQLSVTNTLLMEFKQLRDINHSNLARIFGACLEGGLKALVTECCSKGTLQDLLGNMNITLDSQFKSSLCRDIINGLCYIHQSPIHHHGRLNSNVCLIDNRFSVKLTDFGLPTLYSNLLLDTTCDKFKNECKWSAPEILRSGATAAGTVEGDIYSYGMILLEIITQVPPFAAESDYMTTDEIVQKIKDGGDTPFRPVIELPVARTDLKELIQICWSENPKHRPCCQSVKSSVKSISTSLGDSGNLLENLMRRMELYTNNLEKMVEEKTAELKEEKKKSEELLYQILPRSVVDKLKAGQRVDPQVYDGVTIYFSDIVGFTQISAVSSPMEVVDLLNDIYLCFDTIIDEFDVYKVSAEKTKLMIINRGGIVAKIKVNGQEVETIGDAYMVVSGLPQRNGNLHALNIARMSIKVLEAIAEFKVRHMPSESVKIRIGLNSGPVCAGVVGSKMPRYCLFGDTVNTASRMESSGEAMMIHISSSTKELLDQFAIFRVLPRGSIEVKGKGQLFTYWLLSQDKSSSDLALSGTTT